MAKKQALYIVGAGPMQIPAIRIAKEMDLFTIVADYNADAVGMVEADLPVVMSTKDIEGNVRVARELGDEYPIKGVLTVGTDASMTVAAVANSLGLPGIPFDAAERASNKIKMRSALARAGVPSPAYQGVERLVSAQKVAERLGYPLVIKPADNMGARGVRRVDTPEELESAFRAAKSYSTSGQVVLEEYMDGPELSIDALIHENEVVLWAVADRFIAHPPYFVEMGHALPSILPEEVQREACRVMEEGIGALGICRGAAKGDIKITKNGPMIGELAARLSGGWMSSHTYPLATGYQIIQGAIEIALGKHPSIPELADGASMEWAVIPPPGRVVSIRGLEETKRLPGVVEVILKVNEGDDARIPTSNLDKAAHVIVRGSDREECEKAVERALATLVIETSESRGLTEREILSRAREKFGTVCRACRICDGIYCAGMVPGMGGVGTGRAFKDNLLALEERNLRLSVLHNVAEPQKTIEIFGRQLIAPVAVMPITGVGSNMNNALTEEEYAQAVITGARAAGVLTFLGDGATPEKYRVGLSVIARTGAPAVPIFKPRVNQAEIIQRIEAAVEAGVIAVGVDVDAAAHIAMRRRGQAVEPKDAKKLKELIRAAEGLPFVVKGIMGPEDAMVAVEAGARALIVSNHGGRVLDSLPGAARVLPQIAEAVGKDCLIIADGGVRSGEDVFKYLALGAHVAGVGRPVCVAAVGARAGGVSFVLNRIIDEFEKSMILTGAASLAEITPSRLAPLV